MSFIKTAALVASLVAATAVTSSHAQSGEWSDHTTSDNSTITARHETGSVIHDNKLYVLGGRGDRPVEVFDAAQNEWSTLAPLPIELHHFQPVVVNGGLYVIGAFTCCYPNESNVSDIYRLDLASNTWQVVGTIPANRLRGSAGTAVRNNKIYLIGGNTNGHSGGAVAWFDEYDPATGEWTVLPDAPDARDHFSAALVGNKLIAAAGRTTNRSFGGMVASTDAYDFNTGSWASVRSIPTPRAGATIGVTNGNLIVLGGETDTQIQAHNEVEAYDVSANSWRSLPAMQLGRHGGASGVIGDTLHAISGNKTRGGGREVTDHETLNLSDSDGDGLFDFEDTSNNNPDNTDSDNDGLSDAQEASLQTDPQKNDTDNDSLSDGAEVNEHETDPRDNDSDNDGLLDGDEIQRGTDPLKQDSDNDGLLDAEEINQGTNPLNSDSDADGLSDIEEIQTYNTNPTNNDSDGDALTDIQELQTYFSNPLKADSDNDGLSDSEEILTYNSDPNYWDTDGDGISDATEAAEGTNLVNLDQDGDGLLNTDEGSGDADGDNFPNYLDLDSDNDGIPDLVENGQPDIDNNGLPDTAGAAAPALSALLDSDGDGIPNIDDLDSDQDGISDLGESGFSDPNNMGRIDISQFVDTDQNGWHDNNQHPILDTDTDGIADYLDHDSNDDGTSDTVAVGGLDTDNDGKLDNFSDGNADGFHDEVTGVALTGSNTAEVSPNTNGDNGDNETPANGEPSSGGGGGSILPVSTLALFALLGLRRRKPANVH